MALMQIIFRVETQRTPLGHAVVMGHPKIVRIVLAPGFNLRSGLERQTSTTQGDVDVQEREGLVHKGCLYGNSNGDYPLIVRVFFFFASIIVRLGV